MDSRFAQRKGTKFVFKKIRRNKWVRFFDFSEKARKTTVLNLNGNTKYSKIKTKIPLDKLKSAKNRYENSKMRKKRVLSVIKRKKWVRFYRR